LVAAVLCPRCRGLHGAGSDGAGRCRGRRLPATSAVRAPSVEWRWDSDVT